MICLSGGFCTLPLCTNFHEGGSRVVMASFCCTLACRHGCTVRPSGYYSVMKALSHKNIAVQCVKKCCVGPFISLPLFWSYSVVFFFPSSTTIPTKFEMKVSLCLFVFQTEKSKRITNVFFKLDGQTDTHTDKYQDHVISYVKSSAWQQFSCLLPVC